MNVTLFFLNSSPDFGNHNFFFLPFSAMALPQLGSHNFFSSLFSAMPLPQLLQNFFPPISAMALPQLVCNKIFFSFHFGHSTHTSYPSSRNWAEEFRYSHYRNSTFSLSPFFFFSLLLFVEFRQW